MVDADQKRFDDAEIVVRFQLWRARKVPDEVAALRVLLRRGYTLKDSADQHHWLLNGHLVTANGLIAIARAQLDWGEFMLDDGAS